MEMCSTEMVEDPGIYTLNILTSYLFTFHLMCWSTSDISRHVFCHVIISNLWGVSINGNDLKE